MVMRRFIITVVAIVTLLGSYGTLARPPMAVQAATPISVTIAGDLETQLGCSGDWDAACSAAHLTADGSGEFWTGTWTIPAGNWQYKATINDSWTENYGANAGFNGSNINLNLNQSTAVTFYYDATTHWITDSVNSVIATAPGDYQHFLGCSGDWAPDCLFSWLEDPAGSGTYSFVTTAIPAGSYNAKVTINRSWDTNYGAGGVPGGPNIGFTVHNTGDKVTFTYNPTTHILSIVSGHAHDNNVEYTGLGHNSQDSLYRVPFGAVTPQTPVILRFRTYHNDVTAVSTRFYDTATAHQFFQDMTIAASNVSCYDPSQPDQTCDYWQTTVTPSQPTTLYYRFIITDGTATAYYADTSQKLGGWGTATPNPVDNSYAITVYATSFQTIPWMQNAVIYQIFPDRFFNGDPSNDPKSTDPRYGYPPSATDQILNQAWTNLPEGYCRSYVNPATPCTQSPFGRDYFGGDLAGVLSKIQYLKSLGVNTIYLNPIFSSASDHGYDTRDYMQISPYFGNQGVFHALVTSAHARGLKIILDGVFNHVSSDSSYFDRYHHYSTVGACESVTSPYRSWFTFHDVSAGTGPCAGTAGPNSATYDGWAGFDTLPVLNKNNPQVRALIYGDSQSVVRYWLNQGADGWRFDVMPDGSFPADFWQGVRAAVKATNPNATMICECWQKGDVLAKATQGDQADTTMNYRFRDAVLGFLGTVDNKGFPDDGQSNQPPSMLAEKLLSMRQDYPDATYYTLMNLMDSHDTERILWALTPGQYNREDREFNAANVAQGKQLLSLATVLQMTTPGAPTVYYGDEVGVTGADDPDNRRTFPWTTSSQNFGAGGDHTTLNQYQTLIGLRNSQPVLRQGSLHFLLTDDTNRTLAYLMRTPTAAALVAMNRNSTPETMSINTAGWLPNAVQLSGAYGPIAATTASNGTVTITLPAESAAILLPAAGQNLSAPGTVTGLVATAGNGTVNLTWNGVAGVGGYAVYRSPVTGGGYTWLADTSTASYTDTTVVNGQKYYYEVRARSAVGLLGDPSNEASARPSFPIGYAVLQYPKSLTRTVSVDYTTYYGRVYVHGLTDASGDPSGILAQLGFGPQGSDPATWNWTNMTVNAACGDCGNNYEYQADIRPPQPGTYSVLVRFSTSGGDSWTYGDQNNIGTGTPGVLTATANADTTPPAAPANLRVTDWSTNFISAQWDPVGDAAEYWVYRHAAGGSYGAPIAMLPSGTTSYTDNTVDEGTTYSYVVKAVDAALNVSVASNEVSQQAAAKLVAVTFNVTVPSATPLTDTIYIAGDFGASGYPTWDPAGIAMTRTSQTSATVTLHILDGTNIQYKYTRGSWSAVEKGPACEELNNRTLTVSFGTTGTQVEGDTVAKWADLDHC
jgi:glycosidase